jgi:hypothetical protein
MLIGSNTAAMTNVVSDGRSAPYVINIASLPAANHRNGNIVRENAPATTIPTPSARAMNATICLGELNTDETVADAAAATEETSSAYAMVSFKFWASRATDTATPADRRCGEPDASSTKSHAPTEQPTARHLATTATVKATPGRASVVRRTPAAAARAEFLVANRGDALGVCDGPGGGRAVDLLGVARRAVQTCAPPRRSGAPDFDHGCAIAQTQIHGPSGRVRCAWPAARICTPPPPPSPSGSPHAAGTRAALHCEVAHA